MWHYVRATQRQGAVVIVLSSRAVGDEENRDRSESDTRVLSYSKVDANQTNPQFIAMVKREVKATIDSLNAAAAAEVDVSAAFAVA